MLPRHEWFKNRVREVIQDLGKLESKANWQSYRIMALEISRELYYATTEWERYYHEERIQETS